ncbi:ABC transporter substrate-binding protein [Spirochaetia bacterium]|nr:ABC transporter substrate-binding protein [Spirochaetia bacterium]
MKDYFFKSAVVFAAVCSFVFSFTSCGKNTEKKTIDRSGLSITLPANTNRIISGAPSNTEIIIALGLADKLVAIDKYSSDIKGVPSVPSIDFMNPDGETIINLAPDIIIVNGKNLNGSDNDPFRILKETGITVVYVPMSKSIEDIYRDITFLSDILDRKDEGEKLLNDTKEKIKLITDITSSIPYKKTIYFEISPEPSIVTFGSDTYLNEIIELAGGKNIFDDKINIVYPNAEAIIVRNPDIIITDVNYIDDPIGKIKKRDGFDTITAVKNDAVYYVDANAVSRPTQNVVLAIEQLARQINPEYFDNGE